MLVVVESTQFATSCQGGSIGTDLDEVLSGCESWLVLSIVSVIDASNILLASTRVRRRWRPVTLLPHRLDIHALKFVVLAQIDQACRKCYQVRQHGAGYALFE